MSNEIGSHSRQAAGDTISEAIQAGRTLALRISRLRDILVGGLPEGDSTLPDSSCDGALGRQQQEAFFTLDRVRTAHDAIDEIERSLGMPGASLEDVKASYDAAPEQPRHQTGVGVGRSVPRHP